MNTGQVSERKPRKRPPRSHSRVKGGPQRPGRLTQPPWAWIQGVKLCTCSTLSPAREPPNQATRRLSSMARARRARGSGDGGGGPGHRKEGRARLGQGLPSRLEKSSSRRVKEPAERRASLRRRAGSEASCG